MQTFSDFVCDSSGPYVWYGRHFVLNRVGDEIVRRPSLKRTSFLKNNDGLVEVGEKKRESLTPPFF